MNSCHLEANKTFKMYKPQIGEWKIGIFVK